VYHLVFAIEKLVKKSQTVDNFQQLVLDCSIPIQLHANVLNRHVNLG